MVCRWKPWMPKYGSWPRASGYDAQTNLLIEADENIAL
jgi:hypothetical protein